MKKQSRLSISVFSILFGLWVSILVAAPPEKPIGKSTKIWDATTSVRWSATTLGDSLKRFAETAQFGILLDRRIDPSVELEFEADEETIRQIFERLSASLGLACRFMDSGVYIGPPEVVRLLDELLERRKKEIDKLPSKYRAALYRKTSLQIPFLGEPKELIRTLATQNGLLWKSLEPMPHDVWNESHWPPIPLYELFSLILIGFDGTFELLDDGAMLVLAPVKSSIPNPFPITPNWEKIDKSPSKDKTDKPVSTASGEKNVPLTKIRFTVKVKDQRLDAVLQSLAEQFGMKLEMNEKSLEAKKVAPETRVSFDVKNATAVELLRSFLDPLKLRFRFKKETLVVE